VLILLFNYQGSVLLVAVTDNLLSIALILCICQVLLGSFQKKVSARRALPRRLKRCLYLKNHRSSAVDLYNTMFV